MGHYSQAWSSQLKKFKLEDCLRSHLDRSLSPKSGPWIYRKCETCGIILRILMKCVHGTKSHAFGINQMHRTRRSGVSTKAFSTLLVLPLTPAGRSRQSHILRVCIFHIRTAASSTVFAKCGWLLGFTTDLVCG